MSDLPRAPASLVISSQSTTLSKCSMNVLACHISHTGPVDASSRHWQPTDDKDDSGNATAYFRGRKLRGKKTVVPEGYEGVVLKKTDRISTPESRENVVDDEDEGDDEENAVELHVVEKVAGFNHVTVWNHEALPDQLEDAHLKGIGEWVKFAGAIHNFEDD